MKRFFILWAALHVRVVRALLKLPGLILLLCLCSPAETHTVATLIPGSRVLYVPLACKASASFLEVSYVQERLEESVWERCGVSTMEEGL